MKKPNLSNFALIGLIVLTGCAEMDIPDPLKAPSFCYNASSSETRYVSLENATDARVLDLARWEFYEVEIAFPFAFCGKEFTKLYCQEDEAFATFTYSDVGDFLDVSEYEIHGYQGIWVEGNSDTKITYRNSGLAGDRICKVQYDSLYLDDFSNDASGYLSLQIWLYEKDNKIEVHYGTTDVGPKEPKNITGARSGGPTVGVIGTSISKSAFASGDPDNVLSNNTNIKTLTRLPTVGEVVVFDF